MASPSNANQVRGVLNYSKIIRGTTPVATKPHFVMRKYQPRSQQFISLSHIESNNAQYDTHHEPSQSQVNQLPLNSNQHLDEQNMPANIFEENSKTQHRSLIGILQENGPKFRTDGSVIPHSLVGKPEWFMQIMNPMETSSRIESPMTEKKRSGTVVGTPKSPWMNSPSKKKKIRGLNSGEIISKHEALAKLAISEQRLAENRIKESEEPKYIHLTDPTVYQTHQLQRFDQTASKWNEISTRLAKASQRPPQATLLCSSTSAFRQKVELTSALESAKPPSSILGTKFWEASLRDKFVNFSSNNHHRSQTAKTQDSSYTVIKSNQQVNEETIQARRNTINEDNDEEANNRSFFRELSYTKGTRVAVAFRKDFPIIKHPNLLAQQIPPSPISLTSLPYQDPIIPRKASTTVTLDSTGSTKRYAEKLPTFLKTSAPSTATTAHTMPSLQSISFENTPHYLTAFNLDSDELVVKGENKLLREKQALLNTCEDTVFSPNSLTAFKGVKTSTSHYQRYRNQLSTFNLQFEASVSKQNDKLSTPDNRQIKSMNSSEQINIPLSAINSHQKPSLSRKATTSHSSFRV